MRGIVVFFKKYKGWGFIQGEDGRDYYFHRTDIDKFHFRTLQAEETVEFEPCTTIKGLSAANVRRL